MTLASAHSMMSNRSASSPAQRLSRRSALAGLGGWLAAARPAQAEEVEQAEWLSFRNRFVQQNGRVLDNGNGGQSHSEGQGFGMLFAARFGDRDAFEQISDWRQRVLQRRSDHLHAWHCMPGPAEIVDDSNNATDGDLLIAWALTEAARRWNNRAFFEEAATLAADILRLLVRAPGGRPVLMPGLRGFEYRNFVIVNPSYYVFPAFPRLAAILPDPAWVGLAAHGIALLRASRFGRWQLPPDWCAVAGGTAPPRAAPGRPLRFAYDAVRVPLYMVWAGLGDEPAVAATARLWGGPNLATSPAWVDLATGQRADYPPPPGFRAIAHLSIAASHRRLPAWGMPHVADAADYYSAALILSSRLAQHDAGIAA